VGLYLNRWGFSPQRHLRRAYERDQRAIERGRALEFPKIAKLARKGGAEVHFEDETGVTTEDMRGRGYSPRGVKPIRRHFGKRSSVSIAGARQHSASPCTHRDRLGEVELRKNSASSCQRMPQNLIRMNVSIIF
jgi:hypothetical protein